MRFLYIGFSTVALLNEIVDLVGGKPTRYAASFSGQTVSTRGLGGLVEFVVRSLAPSLPGVRVASIQVLLLSAAVLEQYAI